MPPTLREEKKLWQARYKYIVGLDEAGVGCLAGPVVAGAVGIIYKNQNLNLKSKLKIKGLRDSKELTPKQREKFYKLIITHSQIGWAFGLVSPKVIDKINIKNAAELAMQKALENFEKKYQLKVDFLLIDGIKINNSKLKKRKYKLIIKADQKVFSCAAASIVAKVVRDRIMQRLHRKYPNYKFDLHKGYPTRLHKKMIKKYGSCLVHRKTFNLR